MYPKQHRTKSPRLNDVYTTQMHEDHRKSAAAFRFLLSSGVGEVYLYLACCALFSAYIHQHIQLDSQTRLLTGVTSLSGHNTPSLGNTAAGPGVDGARGVATGGGKGEVPGIGGKPPGGTANPGGAKGGNVGGGAKGLFISKDSPVSSSSAHGKDGGGIVGNLKISQTQYQDV